MFAPLSPRWTSRNNGVREHEELRRESRIQEQAASENKVRPKQAESKANQTERQGAMAESEEVGQQIEELIERAQVQLVQATRQLATSVTKEAERFVPFDVDLEQMIGEVFDFAEQLLRGQRSLVNQVLTTVIEQSRSTAELGRSAAEGVKRGGTSRSPGKRSAKKAAAPNRATGKNRPATTAGTKRSGRQSTGARSSTRKPPTNKT